MNNKLLLSLLLIITLSIVSTEKSTKESFIIPPKQKKESRSAVQEAIGDLLMDNARCNPKVMEQSLRLEHIMLEQGNNLLKQNKNSFVMKADLSELQKFRSALEEVKSTLETCSRLIEQSCSKLNCLLSRSC